MVASRFSDRTSGSKLRKHRVLVVSRDETRRAGAQVVLEKRGLLVSVLGNPDEANEAFHRLCPSVVVVEEAVNLPSYAVIVPFGNRAAGMVASVEEHVRAAELVAILGKGNG